MFLVTFEIISICLLLDANIIIPYCLVANALSFNRHVVSEYSCAHAEVLNWLCSCCFVSRSTLQRNSHDECSEVAMMSNPAYAMFGLYGKTLMNACKLAILSLSAACV